MLSSKAIAMQSSELFCQKHSELTDKIVYMTLYYALCITQCLLWEIFSKASSKFPLFYKPSSGQWLCGRNVLWTIMSQFSIHILYKCFKIAQKQTHVSESEGE